MLQNGAINVLLFDHFVKWLGVAKKKRIMYIKAVATKRNRAGESQEIASRRIRAARETTGMSQTDVGKRLGLSRSGYGHFEDGTRLLTLDDLTNLSRILGRSVEWFLGLDTGLSEDEDQLLASYRAIESEQGRRIALGVVKDSALEYHTKAD